MHDQHSIGQHRQSLCESELHVLKECGCFIGNENKNYFGVRLQYMGAVKFSRVFYELQRSHCFLYDMMSCWVGQLCWTQPIFACFVHSTRWGSEMTGRARLGQRCFVAAKKGEHQKGRAVERREGSLGLFGHAHNSFTLIPPLPPVDISSSWYSLFAPFASLLLSPVLVLFIACRGVEGREV